MNKAQLRDVILDIIREALREETLSDDVVLDEGKTVHSFGEVDFKAEGFHINIMVRVRKEKEE